MSGYTAKVAKNPKRSKDPSPTSATCFGSPFLPLPPQFLRGVAREENEAHGHVAIWCNNIGFGNTFSISPRTPLPVTRSVISHILDNTDRQKVMFGRGPVFGLEAPTKLPGARRVTESSAHCGRICQNTNGVRGTWRRSSSATSSNSRVFRQRSWRRREEPCSRSTGTPLTRETPWK